MTIPKLLGQSAPAAATLTALYTTPMCARATIDTLTICNRAAVATTFRISVAPLKMKIYVYAFGRTMHSPFLRAIDWNTKPRFEQSTPNTIKKTS